MTTEHSIARRHRTAVLVPVEHLNRMGHLGQARYHDLLDRARDELFAPLADADGVYPFALARVELDYLAEVRADDRAVVVETTMDAVDRRKVLLEHRVRSASGEVVAAGRSVLVAFDLRRRRSREITEAERAVLLTPTV